MSEPVGYVDATLRDLAPLPWGTAVGADDLGAAAAALGVVGAEVLEALDPRCARAAMEARSESPWDRLRAMVREAGTTPVGVVAGGRNLWGEQAVAHDVVRQFVLCAAESGARRFRATDPLNDPAAMEPMALAAAEAGAEFVPTLIVGPVPGPLDPSRIEEARALAALPGTRRLCVSDGAGHLSPAALGALVEAVRTATGLPIEVQVQAPGGLAPLSATAAVAAGAAAVQASAGAVALVAARPSAETLRAALVGGPRELACERSELDRAARVVAPMLPADRLRQAARHVIEGRRWAEIEPDLVPVVLGRAGRLRGEVDPAALEAATAADVEPEVPRDLAAVAAEVPFGLSDEDEVLGAMFGETAGRIVERRRSLRAEAEDRPAQQAIDRELLETLVEVVDTVGEAEVSVEIAGARVTVRRAGPAPDMPRRVDDDDEGDPEEGLIRVESPMVGTFYRAPSPDAGPFVEEGQRVAAGDTLCLIEAMKLFNEIVAEQAGVVRRILVENAEPAEFGQLLFLIEP